MAEILRMKQGNGKTIGQRSIYTQELLKVLRNLKEGAIITYDSLSKIIGIGIRNGEPGYGYQKTARHILEKEEAMVFEVVETIGLRKMSPEEVAMSTLHKHLKEKKSMVKRNTTRIDTVSNFFDTLSPDAKIKATMARTVLAFDHEIMKTKNIRLIENKVSDSKTLIGFNETLSLFRK